VNFESVHRVGKGAEEGVFVIYEPLYEAGEVEAMNGESTSIQDGSDGVESSNKLVALGASKKDKSQHKEGSVDEEGKDSVGKIDGWNESSVEESP